MVPTPWLFWVVPQAALTLVFRASSRAAATEVPECRHPGSWSLGEPSRGSWVGQPAASTETPVKRSIQSTVILERVAHPR